MPSAPGAIYEEAEVLRQYLLFHYGEDRDLLPWPDGPQGCLHFPRRCICETFDLAAIPHGARALDLGCAVGRSTFEFARHCTQAVGIDYSRAFIDAANALARNGSLTYEIRETGTITRPAVAQVPAGVDPARVRFEVGDAHAVRDDIGSFDLVLCANLLCRLHTPRRLLARLPDLVNPAGQLVITTPNTWLEEFTARDYWIGATPETGEPLEALQAALAPHFQLQCTRDLPFLIREHRRKFQWSVAQASIWRRAA